MNRLEGVELIQLLQYLRGLPKTFLSKFDVEIIGGGNENERCEITYVWGPAHSEAVGVHSDLIIVDKPFSGLFSAETLKYYFIRLLLLEKWSSGV